MTSNSSSFSQLISTYPKILQQMKLRQQEYISLIKDLHQQNKSLRNSLNDQSRNSTTTNWRSIHVNNQINFERNQTASCLLDAQNQFSNRTLSNSQKQSINQEQNGKMLAPDTINQQNNRKKQFIILGNHHRQNSPKNYSQLQKTIGNNLYNKIIKQVPLVRESQEQATKRVMSHSSSQHILYNTSPNSPRVMISPIGSHRTSPMELTRASPMGSPRASPMGSPRLIQSPRMMISPKLASQNHSVQYNAQNISIRAINQYPPKMPISKKAGQHNMAKPANSQLFAYLQQQMNNTKNAAMCLQKHLGTLFKKQDKTKQVENQKNNTEKSFINQTNIQSLAKLSQKNLTDLPIMSQKTLNQNIRIKDDSSSQVRIVSDKQFLEIQENIQESQVYNIEPQIVHASNQEEKQNVTLLLSQHNKSSSLLKKVVSNNKNKSSHAAQYQAKAALQGDRRITFENLETGNHNDILMNINFNSLPDQEQIQRLSQSPLYRIQYGNGLGKQPQSKSPGHSPKGSLYGSGKKKKPQRINNQIYL